MDERDEVDLTPMHNGPINVLKSMDNGGPTDNVKSTDVKSFENIFPWLIKFNKLIYSSVGHRSYQLLKHLLSLYTQNILTNMNAYYEKASIIIKLKNHLGNTLLFFHLYWNDIKEHTSDCTSYLNEMSVLLGIYIDMELKTFNHSMDASKTASKLLSALWIYLCNSERHIFKVLLKLKLLSTKYSKVYDLVFMRSINSLKKCMGPLTDTDYVRYLLVLKLWIKIRETVEDKNEANKIALKILGPCIPNMRDELLKIISVPSTGYKNGTTWLLQPNAFDLKRACYNFIIFEDTTSIAFKETHLTTDTSFYSSQNILYNICQDCFTNCELKNIDVCNTKSHHPLKKQIRCNKLSSYIFPIKKKNKFRKYHGICKSKPGEVLLIDLTKEDEIKINKEGKKRTKRKLEWLNILRRKCKTQSDISKATYMDAVEVANTQSTSSENDRETVLLGQLPISNSKVSKSMEECTLSEQKVVQNNYLQSIHDYIFNKTSNDLKCMFQHEQCDTCVSSLKQTDIQYYRVLYLLKLLSMVGQNIKHPKAILNLLNENRDKVSCQHSCGNTINRTSEVNVRCKEDSFAQPKPSIEAIMLSKECQNSITNVQSLKQELPTYTVCNISSINKYCQNESIYVQRDYRLRDLKSISCHSSNVMENTKENASRDSHECADCKKIETKPLCYQSNVNLNTVKNEGTTENTTDSNVMDKKSICDQNIVCMLSDLDKCMDVLNRIGEHIITVHAERHRLECLDNVDGCTSPTKCSVNQSMESSDLLKNIKSLANSEKLRKFMELYNNKYIMDLCHCQDLHKSDKQESIVLLNQVKRETNNCQKSAASTTQLKEYYPYGKDNITYPESSSPLSFISNHINPDIKYSIKKEDNPRFQVPIDKIQGTSQYGSNILQDNRTVDTDRFMHEAKHTKESNHGNMIETHSVEEFENIDILDSILNGDITLEDEQEIWKETQCPLTSLTNCDTSNSTLNCATEHFPDSTHVFTNEVEEKYVTSDVGSPQQAPLPEDTLATNGLLSSLFDFDLTNMDSPSNDFIYSSIPTVNPLLIKKGSADENLLTKNCSTTELYPEHRMLAAEQNTIETEMLLQKEKDVCNDKNIVADSCVNVVGFGLNSNRKKPFDLPLPIKSFRSQSSFCDQSSVFHHSDSICSEGKESFPKSSISSPTDKFDTNHIINKFCIFQQKDLINQVQTFNDTTSQRLPEICTANDIPPNTPMNCSLNQTGDTRPSLKYNCTEFEASPIMIKQPINSYELLSSLDLMSPNTDTISSQCAGQNHEIYLKSTSTKENVQHSYKEKPQNYIAKQRVEINTQGESPKRALRCKEKLKIKEKKRKKLSLCAVPTDQNELSLTCSQITVINPVNYEAVQNTRELPLSTFHMPYSKSPKTRCTSTKIHKQLKCVGIQQLQNISQRKQQILLNFHEDSMVEKIFNEDSELKYSHYTKEDIISEDTNVPCISNKLHAAENKMCYEFVNRNMRVNADVTKGKLVKDEDMAEVSSNIVAKPSSRCSLHNMDIQSPKFIEEQIISTIDEDAPPKRRKLVKFSPNLKANSIVRTVSQQKIQKKNFSSTKKGIMCTNRRKNTIVN